jgi:hypothetical protein
MTTNQLECFVLPKPGFWLHLVSLTLGLPVDGCKQGFNSNVALMLLPAVKQKLMLKTPS